MLLANGRLYTLDAANTVVDTLVTTWNAFASHQEEDLCALAPGNCTGRRQKPSPSPSVAWKAALSIASASFDVSAAAIAR